MIATTADGIDRRAVTPPPGAHCTIVSPAARSTADEAAIRSETVRDEEGTGRPPSRPVRRRDRHGRGLRGSLVPPGVPVHRTRSERFDDLVLLAVSQLEPRWEAELSGIEFGVEEIPPFLPDTGDPDPVPLARLEPGIARLGRDETGSARLGRDEPGSASPGQSEPAAGAPLPAPREAAGLRRDAPNQPARIVLYRRPLLARADGEEELAELVLDVIVEQFAHWLGVDPQTVDPGYPAED